MRVIRELKLPGAKEYESSGWSVELNPEDLGFGKGPWTPQQLQEMLHILSREAQIRVCVNAVADGVMTEAEFKQRVAPFIQPVPSWLKEPR